MHFELPDFGKDLMSDVDEQQIENRENSKLVSAHVLALPVAFFPKI